MECSCCSQCEVSAKCPRSKEKGAQIARTHKRYYATPKDLVLRQNEHGVCDERGLWSNDDTVKTPRQRR